MSRAKIGRSVRTVEGDRLNFWCPGCNSAHSVVIAGDYRWQWNGDLERPTLDPSVLVRAGHHAPHFKAGDPCWCTYNQEQLAKGEAASNFKCEVCHSFVRDGRIQFLSDCTHALAGQTVDLPEYGDRG